MGADGGPVLPPGKGVFASAWFELDVKYARDKGYRLFDCYRGKELPLPPTTEATASGNLNVSFTLEASIDSLKGVQGLSGFSGLLLATNATVDSPLLGFLARMRRLTEGKPLATCPYGFYTPRVGITWLAG